MCIKSPLTSSLNLKIIKKIDKQKIIKLYESELEIDVNVFLKNLDEVFLFKCLDTGYMFYYPLNLSGDENFYDQLKIQLPKIYNVSYYSEDKWEYDVCTKFINSNDSVYEIGAGKGIFLEKLKNNGIKKIFGSEFNLSSIAEAHKRGIFLENKTIEQKAKEITNEFDVVCIFQVLEHISNVKDFISSCIKILKPEGKLIIAVPYNNPFLFKNDIFNTLNLPPHHMGLWNKKAFKSLSKYFPIKLNRIIIEKLPVYGYDFERYFNVNKDIFYKPSYPFKKIVDKIYRRWLRFSHNFISGKNIIVIFEKNE